MSREPDPKDPGDETLDRLLTMSADPPQLSPEARARLLTRLQRSRAAEISMTKPRWTTPAYALAAVAASALLIWGVTRDQDLSEGTDTGLQATKFGPGSMLENPGKRPLAFTLADGSTAILREGAALKVIGPRRLELLRGEALLDVVPGAQTFTVGSPAGELEVRGTKFLLRQEADALLTGVLRGEVRLHNAAGDAVLKAGEAGTLSPGTGPARRPAERLSHELQWARDALQDPAEELSAVRRGNLLARFPTWPGEWPLPVRVMDVDVYIEDGVARTTIDQTFFNHTDYELEGVYSFPLPADAAIARLAMYVDGKLMEAGITERQEGRQIYESIVYRRRDPALLEWMQGNEFRMRVFPLPARTEKRILLSYTQPLTSLYGDYSVRVPIPELDLPAGTLRYRVHLKDRALKLDSCCVDFTVTDKGDERLAEATLNNVKLGTDLALTLYPTSKPPTVTAATMADPGGDYLMVRARPDLPQSSQHTPRRWVVLHDTSASRSPAELAAQTRFLRHLLAELDEADRLSLVAFDSTLRDLSPHFSRVDALDPAALDAFLAREGRDHVGATELGLAVDHALALLDADAGPEAPHILYLGDGLLGTPGDAAREALRARLVGRATFVAAALGDEQDLALLDDLSAATGGLRVQLTPGADLRWQALDLAAALNTARLLQVKARLLGPGDAEIDAQLHVSGASLVDGEALTILSRGTGASGHAPRAILIEGTLAGAPWSQRLELPAPRPNAGYLPRLWARAQIDADIRAGAEANRKQITALGLEHFLVTPFTSLLVLENEAMYRQYKVRRPDAAGWAHYAAPAEIKVVREPRGAIAAAPGQIVQRLPLPLLASPGDYSGEFSGGLFSGREFGGSPSGTIGLGALGLIGSGRGGGGSGFGRGAGAGFGGRGTRVPAVRMGAMTFGGELDVANSLPADRFVTTKSLERRQSSWQRDDEPTSASPTPVTRATGSAHFMPDFGGELKRKESGRGYPIALNTIHDARLGDLAEHLPAIFEDGFDREREQMIAAAAAAPEGEISPAARDLLTRARASLQPAHYRVDGGVLTITADGHFTRVRSIGKQADDSREARNRGILAVMKDQEHLQDGHLREIVRYDGDTLTATYPDQDLAIVRRVGLAEPALLSQWIPWLLPAPDALARWYRVELLGTNIVRLHTPGNDEPIDLELDAQLRLIKISRHSGERLLAETRFEYDARGLDIIVGEQHTRVDLARGPADVDVSDLVTTTLELPLRSAPDLAAALDQTEPGTPAWRAIQRQRLATLAALGQHHLQEPVLVEMRAQAELSRGELVLGGAGLILAAPKVADPALAAHPGDPVAAYLAALRRARKNQSAPLEQVASAHPGTLSGLLASHARLLLHATRPVNPTSLAHLRAFLDAYDHPELGFVATRMLTTNYDWRRPTNAPAWEALAAAGPRWRPEALHAAGVAYQQTGDWTRAAERFTQGLAAAVDTDQLPTIDWSVVMAVQRHGHAGWRLQWSRWRDAVARSSDATQLIAFIAAANQLNEPGEVRRVLAAAALDHLDLETTAPLILQLVQTGLLGEAEHILRPLLADAPAAPDLLTLAALLAEHQGRLGDAADLAERALAAHEQLPLAQLRTTYRHILELRARDAIIRPVPGDMPQDSGRSPLDRALDLAARWRAEDPDNAEIDERCAALLFALGQPAEAIRHLASISERHPAEGDAHAKIANLLEREGRFADADRSWQHAIAVEPTNPAWLIGRANNHLATDDPTTARALVEQVVTGKWQDRFSVNVEEARALATRLAAP
jgi:ferric-dicitrate binding protein FerR (iron transport regulator)